MHDLNCATQDDIYEFDKHSSKPYELTSASQNKSNYDAYELNIARQTQSNYDTYELTYASYNLLKLDNIIYLDWNIFQIGRPKKRYIA